MKDLILDSLGELLKVSIEKRPRLKKITKTISIMDVKPIELISFMETNNIPKDADFSGRDNGYDGWNDILLSWEIEVLTTDSDKLQFEKKHFNTNAFNFLYKKLVVENGYKRIPFNGTLLKEFKNTTIYDMFINMEDDKLIKYCSIFFTK